MHKEGTAHDAQGIEGGIVNQGEETNAAEQQKGIAGTEITRELLLALLPTSMGLMLARTGMIVGAYGSYMGTDAGIYTDGASFISLVPLLILMVMASPTKPSPNAPSSTAQTFASRSKQ